MSNVTVTVVENNPVITTIDDVTNISVSQSVVSITDATSGPQGASYDFGDPIYVTVRNATGGTLSKGTLVYTSGGNGTHTQVSPALATSDATSARVLGWLAADIANNASGLCQVEGYLDGINTQGITEGTQLYLSGTTAGSFQTSKPQAPIHLVYVGVAVKASAGNGRVYVKVQNGYELDEIHDVQITSKTDGDLLKYDSATGLWKNSAQSTLNIAPSQITGTAYTLTNSEKRFFQGTTTIDVPSRMSVTGAITGVSGSLRGNLFTPEKNLTITNIGLYVSTAANWTGATTPQAKVAIFSVSGTTLTPVATSSFSASPFTSATSINNISITSTNLVAGTTYAVGMVMTWTGTPTTIPTLAGYTVAGTNFAGLSPVMNFGINATDISGTYTAAGLTNGFYFRLS